MLKRRWQSVVLLALVVLAAPQARALRITSFYSPRNRERRRRPKTDYIILHTTEGPKAGSLDKVRRNGEAHYLVDTEGRVYRIIHRSLVAFHAGRSMWERKTNLDNYSIGIEIVGYHNREATTAQYAALRELVAELQRLYRVPDSHVLTHSMVAYGAPNRWQTRSHRGRKRCAMNFARRSERLKLGLARQPLWDPDVKAGRLVVGDAHLAKVLYGSAAEQESAATHFAREDANVIVRGRTAWDIARDRYRSPDTLYMLPGGGLVKGNQVKDWQALPHGTRVVVSAAYRDNESEFVKEIGIDGKSARDIAGDEHDHKTTVYFLPHGQVRRGDELEQSALANLPARTRMLVGYVHGGHITARRRAFDVCGPRWNHASTFYRLPDGRIEAGDKMDEGAIPKGTQVFFQN